MSTVILYLMLWTNVRISVAKLDRNHNEFSNNPTLNNLIYKYTIRFLSNFQKFRSFPLLLPHIMGRLYNSFWYRAWKRAHFITIKMFKQEKIIQKCKVMPFLRRQHTAVLTFTTRGTINMTRTSSTLGSLNGDIRNVLTWNKPSGRLLKD